MNFENKLVAILNKDLEPGVAMNALAHMVIGFGARLGKDQLTLTDYKDADGNIYPDISKMPFIILSGKASEIKKAAKKAKEQNVASNFFTDKMTGGSYQEQLENSAKSQEDDIIFYGAVLFGEYEKVNLITKRFSLYR